LAILALLLGLVSPLALVNPLLLAVACGCIAVAIVALRQINANPDVLSGRGLAYGGLFLAAVFLAYTPVRLWMHFERVQGNAQKLAGTFLDLLSQGRIYEAHQLSRLKFSAPDPASIDKDFEGFENAAWMKPLKEIDYKFTYKLEAFEPAFGFRNEEVFVMRYLITPDPSLNRKPFPIWINIIRWLDEKTSMPSWKIADVRDRSKRRP
jgi:hypothetical protein